MSIFISIVMFALALIHIYWGHGGNWPGNDRQDLTDKVVGEETEFPSIFSCYTVATLLILAGAIPLFTEDVLFGARFNNYSCELYFIRTPIDVKLFNRGCC